MRPKPVFSQRFLRKGPLVEETYRLFAGWNDGETVAENLGRGLAGNFRTVAWEREVRATTSARLKNLEGLRALILLARKGMRLGDWRDCWRLWVGATEEPFGGFVRDWLFPERQSGRYQVQSKDVREYATKAWSRHSPKRPLSEHGVARAARDLIRVSSELDLLSGKGVARTFTSVPLSDDVLLFHVLTISELEGSTAKAPSSPLWRLAMIPEDEVHSTLLHLHQFRRLDYQVAGSLVQLSLPFPSALAFAESLSA